MAKSVDVSAISKQVAARLRAQFKQHQKLVDELERLRDALGRLEGEVRAHAHVGRGGPGRAEPAKRAAQPNSTAAPARAASPKPVGKAKGQRAPRGQNKAKILDVLTGGPMTAGEIADRTGIAATTASTMLSRMVKAGELAKAERGYALPQRDASR